MADAAAAEPDLVNEVRLRGRVSGLPEERLLPSGDRVVLLRLVVPRSAAGRTTGRRAVDTLDCAVWRAQLRRRAARMSDGDEVEVTGALHRRFWRSGAGVASRYEVEVGALRVVARA
jgi:single-strand DNA-binding protein